MAYTNSPLVSYTRLSPNNSGTRTHAIDRITPHCIVGQWTAKKGCDFFVNESRWSCNYVCGIDGVGLSVEEKNRSLCSSSPANDSRAVTIECASDLSEPYAFRPEVYNRLIDLCVDICKRNGKKKLLWLGTLAMTEAYTPKSDEMVLSVHRWYQPDKSCPGNWLMSRMDELAEKVTMKLAGDTPEPTPEPQEETCHVTGKIPILRYDPMNKSPWVEIAQGKLIAAGYDIKYGADGYFGGATQAALEDYQEKNDLPVTSVFDGPTWAALLK